MRKYSFLILYLLFFEFAQSQTIQELEKSRVFVQAIQYRKDGIQAKANLLVGNYPDDSTSALIHSFWFLAIESLGNQLLGSSEKSDFPIGVYGVKVSPDSKYIAVLQVGEGHPWIDIIDAQLLISERKYNILHTLNPYPGSIDLVKWSGNLLVVASDMPLTDLNGSTQTLNIEKQTAKFKKFSFDPKLKKYAIYK